MATISFELVTVGREAPLYLATETNALSATTFVARVGDQLLLVDAPAQKVAPTGGAASYAPVSPAVAGAAGAGTTFWIEESALAPRESAGSGLSLLPLLVVAALLVYLYAEGEL